MSRIGNEDVRRCIELLEAIDRDRSLLAPVSEPDRLALLKAAGRVANPQRTERARLAKAMRKADARSKRDKDRATRAMTQIRQVRKEAVFVAPAQLPATLGHASTESAAAGVASEPARAEPERLLEKPRNCYVCKQEYRKLHFFYDSMCEACAELNYAKRFQSAPLQGKVALITGGRVKIGFQASLMLLRSGAKVIVTTRFPHDAALRYANEPDYAAWSDRLHLHGLDLRHAPSVELLARHIEQRYDRLDILINNAAQTVRRPPGFYAHLQEVEQRPVESLPEKARKLLLEHQRCLAALPPPSGGRGASALEAGARGSTVAAAKVLEGATREGGALAGIVEGAGTLDASEATSWRSSDPALGLRASAALSMLPYAMEQDAYAPEFYPEGHLDADLQQVDLRSVNTWRLTLAEVATAEMLEVHLVNAVAPFILCARLKSLMLRDRAEPGHIVNVSAMEGIFSRGTKTDKHPHTNMAKAALNMLTLTSAKDYARSNIFMNAVDTGWVTDEDPAHHAERKREELDFEPPLDIVDGAARVVDPVFTAVRTGQCVSGLFFKDYRPASW